MEMIAQQITNQLVTCGRIEKEKTDVYRYGFEIIISTLILLTSIIVASVMFYDRYDGVIFILYFASVRLFCGGFHASSYRGCYMCSLSIFTVVVTCSLVLPIDQAYIKIIMVLLCYLYIYINTPRAHENHPISETKALICRRKIKYVFFINAIFIVVLCLTSMHYSTLAVYTTVVVALLLYAVK